MKGGSLLARVYGTVLDLFFPPRCLVCQGEGSFLHPRCEERLPRLLAPYCEGCSQPGGAPLCGPCRERPLALEGVRAPFLYEGPVREAVHRLKYRGERALAPFLGRLAAQHLREHPLPVEVLAPVPLHPRRERERGYNQALLLAEALAQEAGLPVVKGALRRVRATPPQVQAATAAQRWENTRGAFFVTRATALQGRCVLLIDDVCTTGATLDACARVLRQAGASAVWGLVLAREA